LLLHFKSWKSVDTRHPVWPIVGARMRRLVAAELA
jgi:hypothetical protein